MTLVDDLRERVTTERVDELIIQASDLLEAAALHPTRLRGQRARRQASYCISRAAELYRS